MTATKLKMEIPISRSESMALERIAMDHEKIQTVSFTPARIMAVAVAIMVAFCSIFIKIF